MSETYFFVSGRPGYYVGNSIIGDGPDTAYELYTWEALILRISLWLRLVKNDLDTPDLWAVLQREAKLLGGASNELIENTLFTPNEQKEIVQRLDKLAKDLKDALSLSEAQMQTLQVRIGYLVDASDRLGRKDWLNIFVGIILTYMLSVALPPESARGILLTFLRSIGLLYPELSIE